MATVDIGPLVEEQVKKTVNAYKESIEENMRQIQERAWADGYMAGKQYDPRLRSTWKSNPFTRIR